MIVERGKSRYHSRKPARKMESMTAGDKRNDKSEAQKGKVEGHARGKSSQFIFRAKATAEITEDAAMKRGQRSIADIRAGTTPGSAGKEGTKKNQRVSAIFRHADYQGNGPRFMDSQERIQKTNSKWATVVHQGGSVDQRPASSNLYYRNTTTRTGKAPDSFHLKPSTAHQTYLQQQAGTGDPIAFRKTGEQGGTEPAPKMTLRTYSNETQHETGNLDRNVDHDPHDGGREAEQENVNLDPQQENQDQGGRKAEQLSMEPTSTASDLMTEEGDIETRVTNLRSSPTPGESQRGRNKKTSVGGEHRPTALISGDEANGYPMEDEPFDELEPYQGSGGFSGDPMEGIRE